MSIMEKVLLGIVNEVANRDQLLVDRAIQSLEARGIFSKIQIFADTVESHSFKKLPAPKQSDSFLGQILCGIGTVASVTAAMNAAEETAKSLTTYFKRVEVIIDGQRAVQQQYTQTYQQPTTYSRTQYAQNEYSFMELFQKLCRLTQGGPANITLGAYDLRVDCLGIVEISMAFRTIMRIRFKRGSWTCPMEMSYATTMDRIDISEGFSSTPIISITSASDVMQTVRKVGIHGNAVARELVKFMA